MGRRTCEYCSTEADGGNAELIAAVQGAGNPGVFYFIAHDPRTINPLTAVNTINAVTNNKIFKVRRIIRHFCDISETFLGKGLFAYEVGVYRRGSRT